MGLRLCRKTSDQATTSTTMVDCDELNFAIAANRTYVFRFFVHFTTGATDQAHFSINGPASPVSVMFGGNLPRDLLALPAYGNQIAYDTIIRLTTTASATTRMGWINGIVRNGANAGTMTVRFQSESGGGGASVSVLAGSYGIMEEMEETLGDELYPRGPRSKHLALDEVTLPPQAAPPTAQLAVEDAPPERRPFIRKHLAEEDALLGPLAAPGPPPLTGPEDYPPHRPIPPHTKLEPEPTGPALPAPPPILTLEDVMPRHRRGLRVQATHTVSPRKFAAEPSWIWCGGVKSTEARFALKTVTDAASVLVTVYRPLLSTTFSASEASGQTVLSCTSTAGFFDGDVIALREGHNIDYRMIAPGGVGGSTLTVTAGISFNATSACRVIRMTGAPAVQSSSVASGTGTDHRVKVTASGLLPDTEYFYRPMVDGVEMVTTGWFQTTPVECLHTSFNFVASACCNVPTSTTWQRMSDKNPRIFCHMGDLDYIAPASTDAAFRAMYDGNINATNQGEMYRHAFTLYCPDDQDGAANDGYSGSPGVSNQQAMFRENTPTYDLPSGTGNYESCVVGRILFIKSDNRTERSINSATDNASKIMWSSAQLTWFRAQCRYAKANRLGICWICSNPWVHAQTAGADTWGGYSVARTEVADILVETGVAQQIFIISADMHALAYDNPCPDYSTGAAGATFPVCQAAAIDQTTNSKGGPYDIGPLGGGGQYGLFEVTDTGGATIAVRFRGKSNTDTDSIDETFNLNVGYAELDDVMPRHRKRARKLAAHVELSNTTVNTQVLSPPAFSGVAGVQAPTVTPGEVVLLPPSVAGTAGIQAPQVDLIVFPSAFDGNAVVQAPAVTSEVFLLPSPFAGNASILAPTLVLYLLPSSQENLASILAPTVVPGEVILLPGAFAGNAGILAPQVDLVVLAPTFDGNAGILAPTVAPGEVVLQPSPFVGSAGILAAQVNLVVLATPYDGVTSILTPQVGLVLLPGSFAGNAGIQTPQVDLIIFASVFAGNASILTPVVSDAGGQILSPPAYDGNASVQAPTVQPGEVLLQPSPFAGNASILAPVVGLVLLPSAQSNAAGILTPTLTSVVVLSPPAFVGSAGILAPAVSGTVQLSPPAFAGLLGIPGGHRVDLGLLSPSFAGLASILTPAVALGDPILSPQPFVGIAGFGSPVVSLVSILVTFAAGDINTPGLLVPTSPTLRVTVRQPPLLVEGNEVDAKGRNN